MKTLDPESLDPRIELSNPIQRIVPIGKPLIGDPPTTYADWTSADWELCRSQKMGIVPIPVGIVPILIFFGLCWFGCPGQQLVHSYF